MSEYKTWMFTGCVLADGLFFERGVNMMTWAPTKEKALSNMMYRFKKDNDIGFGRHVDFIGVVEEVTVEDKVEKNYKADKIDMIYPVILEPTPAIQLRMEI